MGVRTEIIGKPIQMTLLRMFRYLKVTVRSEHRVLVGNLLEAAKIFIATTWYTENELSVWDWLFKTWFIAMSIYGSLLSIHC